MTDLIDGLQEQFQESLQEHASLQTATPYQKKAWDHFLELGLPSKQMEVYRYLKLRKLYSKTYFPIGKSEISPDVLDQSILGCSGQARIVLINGHYSERFSALDQLPEKVAVLSLEQALKSYGAFLHNHLAKSVKEETDPFVALNGAMCQGGVFVFIPSKTIIDTPIEIFNLVDAGNTAANLVPRIHVFLGKQSQVELTALNHFHSGNETFSNQVMDFSIEEGASVKLTQLHLGGTPSSWTFDAVRASLKRDSHFHSVFITDGAATVRGDYKVQLAGENSEASLNGCWHLRENKEAHTNVLVEHLAPHCQSNQLFKGVLDDVSSSSFEGKILVRQAAQKTDAFQLNNNLLLSERANADSKPNLEIFADDVKASHGATVGQLDSEQLFYMRSRGYSINQAKNMLVKGYCKEVVDLVSDHLLRGKIYRALSL